MGRIDALLPAAPISKVVAPRRRSAGAQYSIIALLFASTALFQCWNFSDIVRSLLWPQSVVNVPFTLSDSDNRIGRVFGSAQQQGIHQNDLLLTVNGHEYRGSIDLNALLASSKAGDTISVTFSSAGKVRTANVELQERIIGSGWSLNHILFATGILAPVICIVLGFWTVLARPHDPKAWLVLVLLLGFTQILLGPLTERWSGWAYYFGQSYRLVMGDAWPGWMLLFGIYFPVPFGQRGWRALSKVLMWLLLPVLAFDGVMSLYASFAGNRDFHAIAWLTPISSHLDPFTSVARYLSIGYFTVALAVKYRLAESRDAKRRLALLYVGSFISLVPAISITLIGILRGVPTEQLLPYWLFFLVLLLVLLFPLTLAYVIVVHRAVDVRVAIRQGLQYALARNGVVALQIVASLVIVAAAAMLATDVNRNRSQKIEAIVLGFVAVFLLRQGAARIRVWTDRRFFRDAYNAEQILNDLSDEVRSIIEPKTLLQRVAQRISDSLHVRQVAVLLNNSGPYVPAYELGYPRSLDLQFAPEAGTVKQLLAERQPARVYVDDPDSWVNREADISQDERARLLQLHAELLLPLNARDKLLGFISLGQKLSEEPYSSSDLRLLQSVATQTGMALENAQLTDAMAKEMAQREKLNREIEIAREVQERLFPQHLPPIAGLEYFGKCRPALGVGGDYYDFIILPEGKLGIAIGDVAGKGISAALMMASLQASLRGQVLVSTDDLAKVVGNINHLVYEASASNRYATFFYGEYDLASRKLNYVNAGHNPPMLLRGCKLHPEQASDDVSSGECKVEKLEEGGMAVGLLDCAPYLQGSVSLNAGDMLIAYTDGVSEAMNSSDQEWGEENLLQTVQSCRDKRVLEIVETVLAAADIFAAGTPQFDDMTLVIARFC